MRVLLLSFCFCSFMLSASPLKLVSQNFAPFADESETGEMTGVFGPSNTQYSLESFNHTLGDMGLTQMTIKVIPEADGQGLVLLKEGMYQAYYVNRDLYFMTAV
ncbi:hypothetical protein MHO82_01365 [Vibrio sp. Of7-15]|uniref:hypothetical protein n=1 Tax=Vibrio sp. Of7-15 TaxID=2724879 RepID=UPI001EF35E5C|nr:hypothetical protein [Vibrio sp. Of7-15]MCG7495509.1 hypothetical protein [Vibrio sp. Of7-15]